MSVHVEELSPCRRKLTIEVPVENIQSDYQDALQAYAERTPLPGFRPGKAPLHLVKAKFHKDIVQRLRDHLVPKSYQEALQETGLDVLNIVDMDEKIVLDVGEPLRYHITVDLRPSIDLPSYKGISLRRNPLEVTDAEVDARIDDLRHSRAKFEEIADRPLRRGDMAQVDLRATLDGVALEEAVPEAKGLGAMTDFWMQASEEAFIPELGSGLEGLSVGESREIPVTFDANFAVEALRGRGVVYAATLKSLRGRILPELDEEFLTSLGMKNEDKLREAVRDSIHAEKNRAEQDRLRGEVEKYLMDNTQVELPESLVSEASSRHVRRIADGMGRQGMGEQDILEKKEEILRSADESARHSVKLRLILQKIAKEENIRVSDSELLQEVRMMAYSWGMKSGDLEKRLKEEPNFKADLLGDVQVRKTLTFLMDEASFAE